MSTLAGFFPHSKWNGRWNWRSAFRSKGLEICHCLRLQERSREKCRAACGGFCAQGRRTHTCPTWFTGMTHESLKSRETEVVTVVGLTSCSCLCTWMTLLYCTEPKGWWKQIENKRRADWKSKACRGFDNHLPEFLQHQGEDPEVEHQLRYSGPIGRGRTEVQQEHIGEEEEEGKVHDDVTEEDGDGSAPEAVPPAEQKTPPDRGAALSCYISRWGVSGK